MYHNKPPIVKYLILTIVLLLFVLPSIKAQSYNKTSNFRSFWQINVNGGTSLFFGDIKQYQFAPVSTNENEWRFAGGAMLIKQISPIFGIRGQFLYGNLAGTRRQRNLYFESNYVEFNLNATIGIRNIFQKYRADQVWNAYILLGLGITNFNTELMDLQTKKVLKSQGNGSGSSFAGRSLQGMFLGGLGLDLRLSNRVNLNLETANRLLDTDKLDATEGGFKYDVYNYTSLGISYKFGGNSSKQSKKEEYRYFKPKEETDEVIESADYDYNPNKPISPPEVDALTIEPVIVAIPVLPPAKETVVEEIITVPVEEVITEPVIKQEVNVQGIEYRVQIRAKYGKAISIHHLSTTYNIPASEIKENTYNGFYIYTVGSYPTYDQAKERRNYLRLNNGISDSFIVAFRNGARLNKLP
mgnify:CR=1 FL=1